MANEVMYREYGPVVREEVLWNFPLIHLFDRKDIERVLRDATQCCREIHVREHKHRTSEEFLAFLILSHPRSHSTIHQLIIYAA